MENRCTNMKLVVFVYKLLLVHIWIGELRNSVEKRNRWNFIIVQYGPYMDMHLFACKHFAPPDVQQNSSAVQTPPPSVQKPAARANLQHNSSAVQKPPAPVQTPPPSDQKLPANNRANLQQKSPLQKRRQSYRKFLVVFS